MKKLMLIGFLSIFIYACNQKEEPLAVEGLETSQIDFRYDEHFLPFGMNFPEGTVFEESGNTIHFELPEPYYALGIRENGEFLRMNGGGVTCTCNVETGGYSPVLSGGEYGCLMSSCSSCTKSSTNIATGETMARVAIFNPEGSGFVSGFEDLEGKTLLDPAFLDAPEIVKFLEELQANFIESTSRTKKVVFINVYGHIVPIEIPSDIDNTSIAFRANVGDGGVSCECVSAGSCPKKSKLIVTYCDAANCQSCSMTGIIVDEEGTSMRFSVDNNMVRLR